MKKKHVFIIFLAIACIGFISFFQYRITYLRGDINVFFLQFEMNNEVEVYRPIFNETKFTLKRSDIIRWLSEMRYKRISKNKSNDNTNGYNNLFEFSLKNHKKMSFYSSGLLIYDGKYYRVSNVKDPIQNPTQLYYDDEQPPVPN